ncbi:hypothetical protein LIER_28648 [Lithospermum erythrorhizon]|uniref:Uncharacterized protein n=1 Tax=Lithospermum erythrorhizon TaxID=34254 RepID=A0AAV3RIB1_LITER
MNCVCILSAHGRVRMLAPCLRQRCPRVDPFGSSILGHTLSWRQRSRRVDPFGFPPCPGLRLSWMAELLCAPLALLWAEPHLSYFFGSILHQQSMTPQ